MLFLFFLQSIVPWIAYLQYEMMVENIKMLSAHDVISRQAVAKTQWRGGIITSSCSQVSLNICKLCFKFLREFKWMLFCYYSEQIQALKRLFYFIVGALAGKGSDHLKG